MVAYTYINIMNFLCSSMLHSWWWYRMEDQRLLWWLVYCRTWIRLYLSNELVTNYYCLNKNLNPHWRESCSGLNDTNTTVIQCCSEANCNTQLFPRLPSEPTVPTTYPPYRPITEATTNEPTATSSPTVSTPTTAGNYKYTCLFIPCSM